MYYGGNQWFRITRSLKLIAIDEPKTAQRAYAFMKKVSTGNSHTTSFGNTYEIFDYEFYDGRLEPLALEYRGWRLTKFRDTLHKSLFFHIIVSIEDPVREERTFIDGLSEECTVIKSLGLNIPFAEPVRVAFDWEEKALIEVFKYLKIITKFSSWQHYDCYRENKQLKLALKHLQRIAQKKT
jgi:hypothetical protein